MWFCRDDGKVNGYMGQLIIGVDPHKRSATIEIINEREQVLARGRYGTDTGGYQQMLAAGRRHAGRVWAVEGCNGIGRHLAQRLVADGETVLDVPAKLAAKARNFDTGHGRKTDGHDAHHIAVTALRTPGLRRVHADGATVALRLLADRRDQLGVARTETINRLHQLLLELIPGGAKKNLTTDQARTLLERVSVPAGDIVTATRYQLAGDLADELTTLDTKIKAANRQLKTVLAATGTQLTSLNGIGPSGAARLLGDIGDISRFPTRGHFATWNGTAPIDVSSGDNHHHRLNRAGNRRINRVLHIMAITQLRFDTPGRAYYQRKRAEGKTAMEAMRALKRRLSDTVYRQMIKDDHTAQQTATGPGGHTGATLNSSAADPNPKIDTSEKSQPGPANHHPKTPLTPTP
ncbi:transposase [Actinoplanes octamycinicus]|uniref:Transposase n=1 Tax=Actinoplanes octamycinicus TaxID=135948 RepID=A0A7W7GS33_9ACTN|nr:IS110 family transposase [Actinoplanes octamycinicus]MBB4736671.1 transposase [Actinoplanes octamycinicus]MBB4737037.1 transposase [Actinoplanes octamycinicus]MBB4737247.1 transposase [Actinoplanes octamycinicus]MBB4738881.1 transposase [Actinoplanes octamycinicus]MBB4738935.1 transposase [Actinoplanes octamycinicus]